MREGGSRRWTRIFRADPRAEIEDELAFHVEQRVRDNIARGMDPESARAAAYRRLGDLGTVKAECMELLASERRSEARRDRIAVSWLDFKLGFRMLVKYPGLTVVGGLAMAFAIWVGAGAFEIVNQLVFPRLPLPDGDRIVGIELQDAARNRRERKAQYDFAQWRAESKTVQDLGAFRTLERNLVIEGSGAEPVEAAEITASAFRVTRVRPLLGRTLIEADEQPSSPPVAVIGYELWQKRFGGDPTVVGRVVRFGRVQTTVVGVMPEGYGFPIAQSLWVPLRLSDATARPRQGPAIWLFGRLAPGASREEAQAEFTALGVRAAAANPDTHAQLRPQVLSYPKSIINMPFELTAVTMTSNVLLVMLLVLICGNVALLMFARAATRESEIVVRNALGASRARIITQLFAEALVLGGVAALIGLAFANTGLRWMMHTTGPYLFDEFRMPFWFHASLSPTTVLYALLLTLLGAAIAGVVPALKVTRGLQARLREAATGANLSFGGVWTVVIIAQIAVTVAFPFTAFIVRRDAVQVRSISGGFADEQYLSARLEMDRETMPGVNADSAEFATRVRTAYDELQRRLVAEPAVAGVTFGQFLPRMYHPHRLVEVDEGGAGPRDESWGWPGYRVSSAKVDPQMFAAFDAPILAGRGFQSADIDSDHGVIIVNESFVARVLGGHNPIGRRVRYIHFEEWEGRPSDANPGPWLEIIGVVRDLGNATATDWKVAGLYHPVTADAAYPAHLAIHLRSDAQAFTPRLRAIAADVDPTLRLYDPLPMDELKDAELKLLGFWFKLIIMVSAIALVLSLAGIYAVMAFTVARRTREIGIRVALGADARRIVLGIFKRPLAQVSLGIVAGTGFITLLLTAATGGAVSLKHAAFIGAYAVLMLGVCMLACIVPTRRALHIQPTEALRNDG